jgi:phenylacetate-CoA ligase
MAILDIALILREMRSSQRLEPQALEALQLAKLNRLIRHARLNVPRYRSLPDVKDHSDIQKIQILTKSEVRKNPESFLSTAFPRSELREGFTSGSSGVQVPIYTLRKEISYGVAFECHHLLENGISLFDSQARVTHLSSEPNLLQRMGLMRCTYLSVQRSEAELLKLLRSSKADVLCAYPSIVRSLALANNGIQLKMIFTGGELLHPNVRKMAGESFGCPVRDRYGTMESSWVAWECEKGNYHIQSDQAIVEVVDERGASMPEGKVGRILVTPLWRMAMPFIRYDVGDRGAIGGRCGCGRSLPILKEIEGRDDDFITLPSGKKRSARTINLLDDIRGILSYQIVQERPDLFVIRYVPSGPALSDAERSEVKERILSGCLGEEVKVEFEQLQKMRSGAGKIRAVLSKVK